MKKLSFSANTLKMIAIVAMTIDHLAWVLFPGFSRELLPLGMHVIGRLTAPIMWYFIAEGYYHTSDKWRYFRRLLLLAVVSHVAYCFAFGLPWIPFTHGFLNQTSVAWTLAWAVMLLMACDAPDSALVKYFKIFCIVVITLPADWSSIGAVSVMYFYENRGNFKYQARWLAVWITLYVIIYFWAIDMVYGLLQFATLNTLFLLARYNGQRGGTQFSGKFFYYYFPAHMVLIGVLRILLYGNANILF